MSVNKNHTADLRLRRTFGITLDEYNVRLADQGGVCKICGRPPGTKRLAVDHDHKFDRIKITIIKYGNAFKGSCPTFPSSVLIRTYVGITKIEVRKSLRLYLRRKSIRGIICVNCNRGLQKFYDKPERFEAAARYLREFEERFKNEKPT